MDPDALYDVTRIGDLAVSPAGDQVAYLASEADSDEDQMRASLFVVPSDGSRPPHRLSRVADASSPQWSPDGRFLGFVATREEDTELAVSDDEDEFAPEESDESDADPRSQVWVFDMELGGDARQITTLDRGVHGFDWGPEGDRIVVSAQDPDDETESYLDQVDDDGPIEIERLQHKHDGRGWTDEAVSYLSSRRESYRSWRARV